MKKLFVIAFGLFFISLLAVQTVKAQENKKVRKMVVGQWKIGDIPAIGEIDMNNASEDDKKKLEEMMAEVKANSSFNFMQDGKYETRMLFMGKENKETGTWKVDKEGKNFITTNEKGKEKVLSIEELGKNKLILKDGNTSLVLVK